MIPESHPKAAAQVDRSELEKTAVWSPGEYVVGDDRLEKWLLDQLMLSLLPTAEKLQVLGDMSQVLLSIRTAVGEGGSADEAASAAVGDRSERDWRRVSAGDRVQVWRTGERGWALQLESGADGSVRWKAGHSFRPFASCHVRIPKSKRKEHCLNFAAVLVPRCLTHADRDFVQNLAREGLVDAAFGNDPDEGAASE